MRISQRIALGIAAMAVPLLLNTAEATLVSGGSGLGLTSARYGDRYCVDRPAPNQSIDDILAKLARGQQFLFFLCD
jgi:hypothetical protein